MPVSPVAIKAATVFAPKEGLKSPGTSFESVLNATKEQKLGMVGPSLPKEVTKTSPIQHVIASISHSENRLKDLVHKVLSTRDMPQERLIAFQAEVYHATLEIDVVSKGVEQTTSGTKTLLQSQV